MSKRKEASPSSDSQADATALSGLRVLLGVSGGIAAYKAAYLTRQLRKAGAEVVITMTESACRFITPLTLSTLSGKPVIESLWEPVLGPDGKSDVEHIGLVKWAQFAVLAPATMNTLAKLAHGIADDPVSTFFAAYDPNRVLLAPAMNGGMYRSAANRANLALLVERGCRTVGPGSGELACGDWDEGRMAEPEEILAALGELAASPAGPLAGRRVLVSAGPTRERLDPLRYITNGSTGTMGLAIAEAAWLAGARVTLVAGPGVAVSPAAIERLDVESAAEMAEAVLRAAVGCDISFLAAAVADYRPREVAGEKIKKSGAGRTLDLEPTVDILATMGEREIGGFRVGFALETSQLESRAREKLERKRAALIVGNLQSGDSGFGRDGNRVTVFGADGFAREYRHMDKGELGRQLVSLATERAFESRSRGKSVS